MLGPLSLEMPDIYFSFLNRQRATTAGLMKVIQDLAALYSTLLLLTGESGQVRVAILHVSGSEDVETV